MTVVILGQIEGWVASVDDKENDTKSEKIDGIGLVWLLEKNFWCHVSWGSDS